MKSSLRSMGIITFIDNLNLKNSSISQVVAKIWHNSRPRKVGILIWLTLNQSLPTGTWLHVMGISPTYKTCSSGAPESHQHCLLDYPLAQRAWGAFKRMWEEWKAPRRRHLQLALCFAGRGLHRARGRPPGPARLPPRRIHLP